MRDAIVRGVWYGDGFAALIARAVLTPGEWVYGAASLVLGARRAQRAGTAPVPTVSVGNITVGGTGKTPMAAWFAAQLRARGRAPALLLRDYGGDESLVHARLHPDVPVYVNAERRRAAAAAVAAGANALVLDDAFQHRQMPRDADVVLVSADLWSELPPRLLPAGPFREPLAALQRADLIVVTRKAASRARAAEVARHIARVAGGSPIAVVQLALDRVCAWSSDETASLDVLRGKRVVVVTGIGAPDALLGQLRAAGVNAEPMIFADHHAFSRSDLELIGARTAHADRIVCTLKDAVKLGPVWPAHGPPLWYLSQSVVIETGAASVEALLERLVHPKPLNAPGPTGPETDSNA